MSLPEVIFEIHDTHKDGGDNCAEIWDDEPMEKFHRLAHCATVKIT